MVETTHARRNWHRAICILGASLSAGLLGAQPYPAKPIRLIVPQPAGAQNDTQGRLIAQKIAEQMGQQVVVENRPGAGGQIGFEVAAKLPNDGYTLALGSISTLAVIPATNPRLGYDPLRDFAPVTLLSVSPYVVVVHPSLPARTLKELIALAKQRPGDITYGTSGVATGMHLSVELFQLSSGAKLRHVPYKGAAPATTDLVGGHVPVMFNNTIPALPHIKTGRLRALAVTTDKRSPQLPDLPTVAEAGVPGYSASSWQGIVARAVGQKEIAQRLHTEIAKAMAVPDLRQQFVNMALDVIVNSPDEFAGFIRAELDKWIKTVKAAGVRVE